MPLLRLGRALMAAAALVWLLAACTAAAPPVHFFADGRPQHLSEWHLLLRQGGRLTLNERVVPYDLNSPLFSDYAHKLRTVYLPPGIAARYSATQAFDFAAKESTQTHGGIGFTWEADCHFYYKRSRQLGLALGPQRAWKDKLVGELELSNAA